MSERDSQDMEGEGGHPLKRRRTMRGRRGGENNDLPLDGRRAGPSRSLRPRNPSKGKQPKKQPSSSSPVPPPNNPSNSLTDRPLPSNSLTDHPLPTNTVPCSVTRPDHPPSPEVINLCTPSPENRGRSHDIVPQAHTPTERDSSMSPTTMTHRPTREEDIQTVPVPVITPGLDTGFMMTPVDDHSTSGPLQWRHFSRPGLRSQRHPQVIASGNRIALRGHIWTEVQPPPPLGINSPPTSVGTETLMDFDSSASGLFAREPPSSVGTFGRESPSLGTFGREPPSLSSFLATSPTSFNHGLRSPFTPVPPPNSSLLYVPTFPQSDYQVSSSRDVPNRSYYGVGQSRAEGAASGVPSYRPQLPGTSFTPAATNRHFYGVGPNSAVKVEGTTSGVSVPTHRPSDTPLGSSRSEHSSHWSNLDTPLGLSREQPEHSSHWNNLDTPLGSSSRWSNLESQLDRLDFIASQSSRRDGGSSRPSSGQASHDLMEPLSFRFQMSGSSSNGMSSPRRPSQRFSSRPVSSARSNTRHPSVLHPTLSVTPSESRTLPTRDTSPPPSSILFSRSESGSQLGGGGDSDASSSGIHVSINIVRLGEGSVMRGRDDGGRRESTEVIVVDDDSSSSDDDDDVIINGVELGHPQRWRQIASDEAYARDLQAQFDQESPSLDQRYPPSTHLWSSTGPSGVVPAAPSIPSLAEQQQERDSDPRLTATAGTDMIRDNFDALATRVTGWTRHDAGRFLRVASHGRRRRPRTRRDLMNAVLELSPAIIYRAIMGPFSPGATSYEDLLELAESLGPARPQGLSSEAINSLPLKEFSASKETEGSSEKTSCVVCMCEFIEREKIRSLPCLHDFHQKCIDHWLKDHKTCPICRVEVQ